MKNKLQHKELILSFAGMENSNDFAKEASNALNEYMKEIHNVPSASCAAGADVWEDDGLSAKMSAVAHAYLWGYYKHAHNQAYTKSIEKEQRP